MAHTRALGMDGDHGRRRGGRRGRAGPAAGLPKPTELPNPYRLVEGWPSLPQSMNGGRWGEVIRVHVARDGNIWVFHRCFNTVPPGHATCINRGAANPPILEFDPSGKLAEAASAPACSPIRMVSPSTRTATSGRAT